MVAPEPRCNTVPGGQRNAPQERGAEMLCCSPQSHGLTGRQSPLSSPFPVLSFPPTMLPPVLDWHEQFCDCRVKQLKNDLAKRWVIFHPNKYSGPGHPVLHKWLLAQLVDRLEAEANAEDGVGRKYGLTVLLVATWKCIRYKYIWNAYSPRTRCYAFRVPHGPTTYPTSRHQDPSRSTTPPSLWWCPRVGRYPWSPAPW